MKLNSLGAAFVKANATPPPTPTPVPPTSNDKARMQAIVKANSRLVKWAMAHPDRQPIARQKVTPEQVRKLAIDAKRVAALLSAFEQRQAYKGQHCEAAIEKMAARLDRAERVRNLATLQAVL